MGGNLLEIKNLKSWYVKDKLILKGCDFSVGENENLALVGSNGSGKTTMIKTILDILQTYRLDSFTYRESKTDFKDEDFKLDRIGVFSEDNAFKYWTFNEYIRFLHKVYRKNRDDKYENYMINNFHFNEYMDSPVTDLSFGNKKKFFIIAALSLKLPLVILDEPVDGLDFESTIFLYKLIKDYKEYGSILMASHILESIKESCDYYILLDKGKLHPKRKVGKDLKIHDILGDIEGNYYD